MNAVKDEQDSLNGPQQELRKANRITAILFFTGVVVGVYLWVRLLSGGDVGKMPDLMPACMMLAACWFLAGNHYFVAVLPARRAVKNSQNHA